MENQNTNTPVKEAQSKILMAVVCWFVGSLGVHRYMMGYSNWWHQLLATVFLCGVGGGLWALYDLVMILTGKMKMADGRDLV
jgi:hypothetical protein